MAGKMSSSTERSMPLAAFIDLVGIRALASSDPKGYVRRLDEFHRTIGEVGTKCLIADRGKSGPDRLFFFSDCAYVSSHITSSDESPSRLVEFLAELRQRLLLRSIFFKAAVGCYDLKPIDASIPREVESKDPKSKKYVAKHQALITGQYFDRSCAELFGKHEEFKGIGIRVVLPQSQNELTESAFPQSLLVRSCFINSKDRNAHEYWDTPLSVTGSEARVSLDNILKALLHAKSQDRRYSTGYVSLLVAWVRSVNLTSPALSDDVLDDGKLTSVDPMLSDLTSGRIERCFTGIPGYEQIFFAFVHSLVTQERFDQDAQRRGTPHSTMNEDVGSLLWRWVAKEDRLLQRLQRVPSDVCDRESREEFIRRVNEALRNLAKSKLRIKPK